MCCQDQLEDLRDFRHTLSSGYTDMSPASADKMAVASVSFQRAEKGEYPEQCRKYKLKSLFEGSPLKMPVFTNNRLLRSSNGVLSISQEEKLLQNKSNRQEL